jgi:hypothetical protein
MVSVPRWRFVAALWAALLFSFASCSSRAAEVEAFAQYQHTSDLFRGKPFNNRDEESIEQVTGGVTIAVRAWEIDLSHGYRFTRSTHRWETSTQLAVRFYPGRTK